MALLDDLGPGPVAVDTVAFIYLIEEDPTFLPIVLPLFEESDRGRRQLVTSALTLLEVLVVPYRVGDRKLAQDYETLLTRSRGVQLVGLTRDLLQAAAQLRATARIKTPDALQMAAALATKCGTFVTNDRRLPPIAGLRTIQLSSYCL